MKIPLVCASVGLLASLVWLVKVDYDRPWRDIQDRHTRLQTTLAWLDVIDPRTENVERAARRYKALSDATRRRVINLPLLDFLAPRGTAGAHEIKQVVVPEVRRDLHFAETDTTDRCPTCHVAIDNGSFAPSALARRLERALVVASERFGAEKAVSFDLPTIGERPDLAAGEITRAWWTLSESQRQDLLDALLENVNGFARSQNQAPLSFDRPVAPHPDFELYVADDSPHPARDMGCSVCHEGNGEETDFVLAAHTPPDRNVRKQWKDAYYVRHAGSIPEYTFESAREHWPRPMLPPEHIEANCAQCHPLIADTSFHELRPRATQLNEGRLLYTRLGCGNCHPADAVEATGRVGADLTHIADKLSPGFVKQWILTPKTFRPSTWMPHSFGQENDIDGPASAGETEALQLDARTKVAAITHYLFNASLPYEAAQIPESLNQHLANQEWLNGTAERGRRLFDSIGCLACHAALDHRRSDPNGTAGETVGARWIIDDLAMSKLPADRNERAAMSDEAYDAAWDQAESTYDGMSHADRIEYALEHFPNQRDTILRGHRVDGPIFTRFAPELSGVGSKFPDTATAIAWLYDWLLDPRSWSSETKMPRFSFASGDDNGESDEALDLAVYLSTLRDHDAFATEYPQSIDMQADPQDWLDIGRALIDHYGCAGCHRIPGFERAALIGPDHTGWGQKDVSQLDFGLFDPVRAQRRTDSAAFRRLYPPDQPTLTRWVDGNPEIHVETTRASFAWHQLRNPRIWDRGRRRSADNRLRMPNFYLSGNEARALVTCLLSFKPSRVAPDLQAPQGDTTTGRIATGRNLARDLNCYACHCLDHNTASIQTYYFRFEGGEFSLDEHAAPPPLRGPGARVQPEWLAGYFRDVPTIRPWLSVRMPVFHLTDDQRNQLIAYLVAVTRQESTWLADHLRPVEASLEGANGESAVPELSDAPAAWYLEDDLGRHGEMLRRYAREQRLVPPFQLDPTRAQARAFANAHQTILHEAAFLAETFAGATLLPEPPPASASPDSIADGRTLFMQLQCLSCHVFGDPTAPGASRLPTAPDLQQVAHRLRADWVGQWLAGPRRILPGTRMPSFFGSGDRSAFADDRPTEREVLRGRLRVPERLDDASAQIEALIAFLFDASRRHLDVVTPPRPEATRPAPGNRSP